MPGTNRSWGLSMRSFNWIVLMSRLRLLTSRWVAKSAWGDLAMILDFGGHAGDEPLLGIVDEELQLDRLDVALAAAHVALGGEVGLGGLADDLPLECIARGHDDAQGVAELNGIGLRLRQGGVDPGLGEVHDGCDGRAGGHDLALAGGEDVDFASDRREDLR